MRCEPRHVDDGSVRGVERERVVVIGAGPGGLAVAASLGERGVDALVVDRSSGVGSSWRTHYDRLHLHTPRRWSGLPGLAIPRRHGRWVARDDVVSSLEQYAAHHRLRLRLGSAVTRVARGTDGPRLVVELDDGARIGAEHVVVATGYNHTPADPGWPGREGFTACEVVHVEGVQEEEEGLWQLAEPTHRPGAVVRPLLRPAPRPPPRAVALEPLRQAPGWLEPAAAHQGP